MNEVAKQKVLQEKIKWNDESYMETLLKKVDLFGEFIVFNLDEVNKKLNTKIGGFMTIMFVLSSFIFVQLESIKLIDPENYKFQEMKYAYNSSLYEGSSMEDYSDSFNMFIGT